MPRYFVTWVMDNRRRATVALIGAVALAVGLILYAFFRPVRIPLIPAGLHFAAATSHTPAVLGVVPSVIHAFAMPLLTVACLRLRRRQLAYACLAWCAIDLVLEAGQRTEIAFFPAGTFDPLDLLGVLLGAALAGAVGLAKLRSTPR
jgi:hypothetical protein